MDRRVKLLIVLVFRVLVVDLKRETCDRAGLQRRCNVLFHQGFYRAKMIISTDSNGNVTHGLHKERWPGFTTRAILSANDMFFKPTPVIYYILTYKPSKFRNNSNVMFSTIDYISPITLPHVYGLSKNLTQNYFKHVSNPTYALCNNYTARNVPDITRCWNHPYKPITTCSRYSHLFFSNMDPLRVVEDILGDVDT